MAGFEPTDGVRSSISEPDRGRRRWTDNPEARDAVYRNRKRIRGARGKRLLRQRGERLERPRIRLALVKASTRAARGAFWPSLVA